MRVWWIFERGETRGPYTNDDFEADVRVGRITSATLVWTDGLPGWTPLGGLKRSAPRSEVRPAARSADSRPASAAPTSKRTAAAERPAPELRRPGRSTGLLSTGIWATGAALGVALLLGATYISFMPEPSGDQAAIAGLDHKTSVHGKPVASNAPAKTVAGHVWINPITGKQVELPAGWRVSNARNASGEPLFVFRQPDEGLQVVFANEPIEPGASIAGYIQALTSALAASIRFEGQSSAVTVNDKVVVEQQGRMIDARASSVHLSVVPDGDKVWRAVAVGTDTPVEQTEDFRLIRERLFESF